MPSQFRTYFPLLRRYLAPQRWAVTLMAAFLLGSTALQIAGPQVARGFIDAARTGVAARRLLGAALLFLAIAAGQQLLKVLAAYWSERVAWTATNALRVDLAAHVIRLDPGFYASHPSGELIERVDGDVSALAQFFSGLAVQLGGSALLLAGVVVAMWRVDAPLGWAFAAFGLAALGLLGWVRGLGVPHWRRDREQSAAFYGYLGEVLAATEDLRSSAAVPYAMRRFFQQLKGWRPIRLRAELWGSAVWIGALVLFAAADSLAYALSGGLYRAGAVSMGTVYLVVAYAAMLVSPIETIRTQLQDLQLADAAIARVGELLAVQSHIRRPDEPDTSSRVLEAATARQVSPMPGSVPGHALGVEFDGVTFCYVTESCALESVSFRVEPGRVLGVLGRTGSGKTTIARLLFRFYDPQRGTVRLGGIEAPEIPLDDLRGRIGLVTQDVQIFEASLRDNLAFYDARVPDDRLVAALAALGLSDWLAAVPGGLDTPLSPARLSAGQAQLVAMARVLLKNPGLIILDEASSRLDPATEALLSQAVDRLLSGRTAIIIAHRLPTVQRVHDILILEDGRVLEHGPREQLAADPGSHYSRLLGSAHSEMEEALQ